MPNLKVETEQFEKHENMMVHRPTGARFGAYPGGTEIEFRNWGRAGEVLPNGEEYDRTEVEMVAAQLLRERLKNRTQEGPDN